MLDVADRGVRLPYVYDVHTNRRPLSLSPQYLLSAVFMRPTLHPKGKNLFFVQARTGYPLSAPPLARAFTQPGVPTVGSTSMLVLRLPLAQA